MIGDNIKIKSRGFSLLELITVIGLLLIIGTMIAAVYMQVLRTQRHASARQTMVGDIRGALETITQHIKAGEIDYASYDSPFAVQPIIGPQNKLAIRLADGSVIEYALDNDQLVVRRAGQVFRVTNPAVSRVVRFDVYISPETNPFREELCNTHADCSATSQSLPSGGCTEIQSKEPVGLCACDDNSDCQVTYRCQLGSGPATVPGVCVPPDTQPRVTIMIGIQELDLSGNNEKVVYFQSTISSRTYQR
jgi:type II secretory pathway pseudopilin PulG